jgi:hypothetical protein
MREHRLVNEIHIQRTPQDVFHYVSQPWRWHEWHPASESAIESAQGLKVGDSFDETVSMQPFSFLTLRMRRQLRWTVFESQAPRVWEAHGSSSSIDVRARYELHPSNGTLFRRTFHYQVKGWLRWIERYFVLARMQQQSVLALSNLKRALEAQALSTAPADPKAPL